MLNIANFKAGIINMINELKKIMLTTMENLKREMETKKEPKGNSKCEKYKTEMKKKKKSLDGSTAHLRYQKKKSENLQMDQQILYLKNRKKKDERKVTQPQ